MKTSRTTLAVIVAVVVTALTIPSLQAAPSKSSAGAFSSPPRDLAQYGHIRSLVRKGSRYELRFDPAFWLGGSTANRAALEDKVIGPGETVPNDYYIRDESRQVLTYRVPTTARATVLVQGAGGIRSQRVGIAELAQIVRVRNPQGRRLYDRGNHLGYWARIQLDTVRALDQQYQP